MHKPVLYHQVLEALQIKPAGVYLDGTFGRGGHAQGVLQALGPEGRLLACDRDPEAIAYAQKAPSFQDPRFHIAHSAFAEVTQVVESEGLAGRLDGILLDLGVSSPQLDDIERGFSFQGDGPLDMRMDLQQSLDASAWLAKASEAEISEVLWRYGEERYARRIARAIVDQRALQPLTRTQQLVSLIEQASPRRERHKHPATRSFQAIRMKVNDELGQLQDFLNQALQMLAPGGRLVVISFHSLEDRLVKQWMRAQAKPRPTPSKLPVRAQDNKPSMHILTRKPLVAEAEEICHNPRSRSAKLRVAEKCNDNPQDHAD
jgi:16S rRNA (cytosine1402-N4)-methyltransferase